MSIGVSTDTVGAAVRDVLMPVPGVVATACAQFQASSEHYVSVQVNVKGMSREEIRPVLVAGLASVSEKHPDWPELRLEYIIVM